MKKILPLLVMILLPMVASADAVEIDGIYYNLITKGNVAEVTTNPNQYTGSIAIPESVKYNDVDYSVASIGERAFQNSTGLTSVTIPNGVTSIGECAFQNSTGLTSITIPNTVTSISQSTFYGCTGLTSIAIPNSVTSIGGTAFFGCTGLTSIAIPNSVTSIDGGAFAGCTGLTSIAIPNSVTSIGESTFAGCTGLTSIAIPNSVTSIGYQVFSGCSGLTTISIPNSVTSIGNAAFRLCSGLTSITIPNSVTSISQSTFESCTSLTSITIPNSVTSIGKRAFSGCTSLTSVTIPNGVTSIGEYAFIACSELTSVTIPNGVTSIGEYTFGGCSALTSISIPNGITSIGVGAFNSCSGLTSITIGSGIKNIYKYAFAFCPNLTDVTCYASKVPNTNSEAFKDSYIEYATLHVPSSAVYAYKAAEPWKNFKSIVATEGETPTTQKCEKPTISYENGQLKMACATDGVEYVTDITNADIKKHYDATITITATYNISVYATKSGYDNSDVATATLCWIDQTPKTEGITNGVANIPANAVLIQSEGGTITVQGCDEGEQVSVYSINGTQAGTTFSQKGAAIVNTNLQPGSIAIVKIGQKSVKVVVK